MGIKENLENKIQTLGIKVDKVATIKRAVTKYNPNASNSAKFNRANSGTYRAEFFIFEELYYETVIEEFKKTTEEAFRKDQTLIIKDTTNNKYKVYKNRDFENPLEFDSEDEVIDSLIPNEVHQNSDIQATNTIYFGSPGTGKSNTVDELTKGKNVRKVTFHPEYDYHSFVGGYKPSMNGESIVYKFVPQIFTKIYVEAWKNLSEHYYLQIEEINRGNCAQIFGDLFQLLDRDIDGSSRYDVDASEDLVAFLEDKNELGEGHEGINKGKIKLPHNLSLIATMNTSDQSLFPMDSAFKRRWDWEYIPINYYCGKSDFTIKLNDTHSYKWLKFLEEINKLIFEVTDSPDKQIGNWFVNPTDKIISEKIFINKVLFYLWNDVFKDEDESFFNIDGESKTYEDFFIQNTDSSLTKNINTSLIVKMIDEHLDLENQTVVESISE